MPDDAGSGLSGFKEDTSFLDRASQVSQISQDTRSSYQLFDGISPGDSVSRLMSQVEDGFNTQEQLPGHQPSQRNSVAGSNILKPAPSAKHRVTFLTPKTANARAMQESSAMSREIDHSSPGTVHLKEPSSRRFILEGSRSTRARPDQAMPQLMDTWNDEDADEVLRSLRMDEGGFDSFHSSQGQELVLNGRVSGPITGSSGSSDPWSARSGSSYSQPSASYPSSVFETSPEQDTDISYGGSYSMKSNSKPHLDSMSKDETPRAGSVARFRPEIVTGPIRASSSRAALIPSISSPMLAKSQSAHVIGSPANQYRRFSPQIATVAQLGEDQPKSAGNIHTASAEAGHVGEQSTIREVTGERSAMVASGSARHSVLLPPSSSTLTVAPDAQAHLRSRSVPEPSGGHPGSATVLTSDATPKSTVRSRVAALEERSRSRPISQYSNASSVNSLLHYK
ncbi:hypothetical protein FRC09_015566 [Ceratobasidium sp. 395]|nr:hypothetical protein FRC09_015566 [Ceratobasidium sp. 395]